jgi:O-antigen ligase
VLGLIAVFATGSRGALVGFPVLVIVAAFLLLPRKRIALLVAGGIGAAFIAITLIGDLLGARSSSLFDLMSRIAGGETIGDDSVRFRMIVYRAGISAFADAPIFGHGWTRLMSSIVPYLSPADLVQAKLPHLHNDALNFGVLSGVFGIAVYVMLLALPPLCCLFTPRDSQFRPRLYGCWLLSISYFVLGLPDTMLSFELHTALYVALTAILLNYCRDVPAAARP